MDKTLEVHGLSVRIGRHSAVHEVDLSVSAGVTGLLGPNGAGKTTLLRTLATLLPPTEGRVSILGQPLPASGKQLRALRARIGYAPQANTVLGHLTVEEQVAYAAWLKGLPEAEARRKASVAVERVDLTSRVGTKTARLSGGMLRRLTLAMAIVTDPDLILLDEPTAGLDPEQRVRFRELVSDLGTRAVVVLSTHLIEDVVAACVQIGVMRTGRLVFSGTRESLAAMGDRTCSGISAYESAFLRLTRQADA